MISHYDSGETPECEYSGPESDCPRHGERCPDCGMRGLHAVDHGMSWPADLGETP